MEKFIGRCFLGCSSGRLKEIGFGLVDDLKEKFFIFLGVICMVECVVFDDSLIQRVCRVLRHSSSIGELVYFWGVLLYAKLVVF